MAKRLGERLVEAGLVSTEAVEQALAHQKISAQRIGDCLVELGLINETVLLRFLAAEFKTRFVSAEKLSKAKIGPDVLEKVPVRMAEAQTFLPIAYDPERKVLSIVMAEPQNEALVKEITLVTEMNEVFAYVGVTSAIQAGIKKHYYGDPTAFAALEAGGVQALRSDVSRMTHAYESTDSRIQSNPSIRQQSSKTSSRLNPTQLRESLGVVRGAVSENDYIETLNIFVGIMELQSGAFRGHSAQVARQAGLIARRIGLSPRDVNHTVIASYLHELGKKGERHLTLLVNAEVPQAKADAKRLVRTPVKMFETVHLPGGVNAVLAQIYEAFDGSGVPQGVRGEEISAGARVIAAVDAFFDLTRNVNNHLKRALGKSEALELLRSKAGSLFDPVVVEALASLQSGDLLRQRVENDGRQIFIADADEAVRTDLVDALGKVGLVVQAVVKLDGVVDAVMSGEADTVAAGLGYGVTDLVSMTQYVRARPESASMPVLILGEPTDSAIRERLVLAGVTGFLPTPVEPESAAATIRSAFLDRVEHGGPAHLVRGTFDELSPNELLAVLSGQRKTGRLTVRQGGAEGYLQLEKGRVIFAQLGEKKGEAALPVLLVSGQADFQYDADALPSEMPNLDTDLDVVLRLLPSSSA